MKGHRRLVGIGKDEAPTVHDGLVPNQCGPARMQANGLVPRRPQRLNRRHVPPVEGHVEGFVREFSFAGMYALGSRVLLPDTQGL